MKWLYVGLHYKGKCCNKVRLCLSSVLKVVLLVFLDEL